MRHALRTLSAFALIAALSAAAAAAQSGWLVQAQGSVEVNGPSGPLEVKLPLEVPSGATIRTGAGGAALFMLADGSKVQLTHDTSFTYEDASGESLFNLFKGAISLWVKPQGARRLGVRMPGAVASVRGTIFDAATDGVRSHLDLFEGELLTGDTFGRSTILSANQRASFTAAHGLSGTSSLPPGARAKTEPDGELPNVAKKNETGRVEKKEDKKDEKKETKADVQSESSDSEFTPPPSNPTSNPTQEIDTDDVSPSAP